MNKYKYLLSISMLGFFSQVSASDAECMPTDQQSNSSHYDHQFTRQEGEAQVQRSTGVAEVELTADHYSNYHSKLLTRETAAMLTRMGGRPSVSHYDHQFTRHGVLSQVQRRPDLDAGERLGGNFRNSCSQVSAGATAGMARMGGLTHVSHYDHQATPYGDLSQVQRRPDLATNDLAIREFLRSKAEYAFRRMSAYRWARMGGLTHVSHYDHQATPYGVLAQGQQSTELAAGERFGGHFGNYLSKASTRATAGMARMGGLPYVSPSDHQAPQHEGEPQAQSDEQPKSLSDHLCKTLTLLQEKYTAGMALRDGQTHVSHYHDRWDGQTHVSHYHDRSSHTLYWITIIVERSYSSNSDHQPLRYRVMAKGLPIAEVAEVERLGGNFRNSCSQVSAGATAGMALIGGLPHSSHSDHQATQHEGEAQAQRRS